jgi:hypothetical protein
VHCPSRGAKETVRNIIAAVAEREVMVEVRHAKRVMSSYKAAHNMAHMARQTGSGFHEIASQKMREEARSQTHRTHTRFRRKVPAQREISADVPPD